MPAKRAARATGRGGHASVLGFVLTLLAAVMLPLSFAAPAAAAGAGGQAVTIEICSEGGSKTVEIGGETDPDQCSCQFCLCCLPGNERIGAPLPRGIGVVLPVPRVTKLALPETEIPAARAGGFGPAPRGPPETERENMFHNFPATRRPAGATARTMGASAWS